MVVLVVIRAMVLPGAMQIHMMVEWIQIGICSLRAQEVAFLLMVHQALMHLVMDMVLPIMVLDMVVMVVMAVPVLAMVDLLVLRMGILTSQVLGMQVVHLVPLEAHGAVKLHLAMVPWATDMLHLGAHQMLVLGALVLVQLLLVNLLVGLLGMGIKVMDMVVMLEMMDPMGIQLDMELLGGVLGVLQTVILGVHHLNYRGVAVATWEVVMGMQMEIQGMEMQVGDPSHNFLEIMGLRAMDFMVGNLVMVGDTVVLRIGKANNSDHKHIDANWILITTLQEVLQRFLVPSSRESGSNWMLMLIGTGWIA